MEQDKGPFYKYTELKSLKTIENEFWTRLDNNLRQDHGYEKVNLKQLIKLHKSINNIMLKMISQTAEESKSQLRVDSQPVDEVDCLDTA